MFSSYMIIFSSPTFRCSMLLRRRSAWCGQQSASLSPATVKGLHPLFLMTFSFIYDNCHSDMNGGRLVEQTTNSNQPSFHTNSIPVAAHLRCRPRLPTSNLSPPVAPSVSPSKLRKILYIFKGESLGRLRQNRQGTKGSKSHDTLPLPH